MGICRSQFNITQKMTWKDGCSFILQPQLKLSDTCLEIKLSDTCLINTYKHLLCASPDLHKWDKQVGKTEALVHGPHILMGNLHTSCCCSLRRGKSLESGNLKARLYQSHLNSRNECKSLEGWRGLAVILAPGDHSLLSQASLPGQHNSSSP